MIQIAKMTNRQFRQFSKLAHMIYAYTVGSSVFSSKTVDGACCEHCGYSLLYCSLFASQCEHCETFYCGSDPAYCGDCGDCSLHCSANNCGDCGEAKHSHCDNCSCCDNCCCCEHCGYCGETVSSSCNRCYRCEDCCNCVPDFTGSWSKANHSSAPDKGSIVAVLETVDPVQSMADFYLAEWIMAYMPGTAVAAAAAKLQAGIVNRCAAAFLLYGPVAIGGELRHHGSAPCNSGRNSSGRYFLGLAQSAVAGKQPFTAAELFKDAAEVFYDGSWSAGYGGEAWRDCAMTFYHYYAGNLSAKQFVDRCFSLQHNGGSFLNKMGWASGNFGLTAMEQIGNVHAAAKADADIAALAAEQFPTPAYATGCGCYQCQQFHKQQQQQSGNGSQWCSPTASALWQQYRALMVPASRRKAEARRAAYYGTVWA